MGYNVEGRVAPDQIGRLGEPIEDPLVSLHRGGESGTELLVRRARRNVLVDGLTNGLGHGHAVNLRDLLQRLCLPETNFYNKTGLIESVK